MAMPATHGNPRHTGDTGNRRIPAPTAYMPASRPRGPTAVPSRVATARDIPGRYPTARADASPTYPRGPTAQPSGNRRAGPTTAGHTGPTAVPLTYRATARGPTIPATVPYPRADTGYNQTGPTLTQPRGPLPAPIPGRLSAVGITSRDHRTRADPRRPPDQRAPGALPATPAQVCYNPRQQTPKPPSNTHSNPKTESNTCSIEQMFESTNVKT